MESKKALIVFQKNPVLGKVKTRLAATLGEEQALKIYMQLLQHTYSMINQLQSIDTFIYFSEEFEPGMDNSFLCNVQFRVQNGIDLGSRMKNAFDQVLCEGYEKAVVIGTDCPGITTAIINEAFKKLNLTEVVFGPAEDGGYYLLGLKKIDFNLFNKMTWSNQHVLSESIRRLNLDHISFKLLEMLSDIDNESDWEKCKNLISKPL
jgi:rSAM/selenodomain-associated transferase 1